MCMGVNKTRKHNLPCPIDEFVFGVLGLQFVIITDLCNLGDLHTNTVRSQRFLLRVGNKPVRGDDGHASAPPSTLIDSPFICCASFVIR